jgi:aspartyl/asparaginyl-tRNA synthetase
MRTLVSGLKEKVGQQVKLYLTLDVLRDQKHLQFILAHDKSGAIQLVVSKKTVSTHEEIGQLLQGSTFIAHGKVVEASQSKTFGIEIQIETIEIMSKAQAWPITQESSIDLRFDYRVVDLKFPKQQLMLKLRSAFLKGCREYLDSQEFVEISTPKLLGTASESGSEVFKVDYFDQTAYLAQSPQFYKEAAIASGLERVYEVGPVFRAESSFSSRHLCEFTGLDIELAFCFKTEEVMKVEEEMMVHALSKLEPFKAQVKELYGIDLTTAPTVKYMTLDEAKEILKEKGIMSLGKEEDLPDHGEKMLFEILGVDLIFVSDYPIAKRPFYHMWDRETGTTKSFDLIFKGIEITSGAIRQHQYEEIVKQAQEKSVSLKSISGYLQSHQFGMPIHGGFGLGVERVISRLLGITVKESSMFPRDPERLTP